MFHQRRLLWALSIVIAGGCGSANVPPEQARIKLVKLRTEQDRGESIFPVDYKFTKGRPERGWLYQLGITSEGGDEYTVDTLMNEKQVTGTFEGRFKHFDARRDTSKKFKAYVQMRIGSTSEFRTLSDEVEFEVK